MIAILDYWSQSALSGLHNSLNRFLRDIKMDCTFRQNNFLSVLPIGPNVVYHSVDLSAATDRMPLTLQKRVIAKLSADAARSEAWARILVNYPFNNKDLENPIYYRAGQPMGAYSS